MCVRAAGSRFMSADAAIGDRFTVPMGVPKPSGGRQNGVLRRVIKRQCKGHKITPVARAATGLVNKK